MYQLISVHPILKWGLGMVWLMLKPFGVSAGRRFIHLSSRASGIVQSGFFLEGGFFIQLFL